MKILNLKDTVFRPGEYIVGAEQTHSRACYLLYGLLKPQEQRTLSPGKGHEEIFCCLEGQIKVSADKEEKRVEKGQCFHLKGDQACEISNQGQSIVIYVLAGGHSDKSHHEEGAHHGEH